MIKSNISTKTFLKDVLVCSLGAYGGPEAHYGVFTDQLVIKKAYLSEEELVELIALNSILPGPTSTQTITSIGYKIGGPKLALLTLLIWVFPAILFMTFLSFLYQLLNDLDFDVRGLRYIGPMAVSFILLAAFRINRKVLKSRLSYLLCLSTLLITFFIRSPWIFPLLLISGGLISTLINAEPNMWQSPNLKPKYAYLLAFISIAVISLALTLLTDSILVHLFESFYRYGYLVFGGGQVVIPVMFSELVEIKQYMTDAQFLTGYGLVQGLPGPMFSFSAYAGGMAARSSDSIIQVLGALLSGLGIFLPGTLLIFFIYPIWESLRKIKGIKIALTGVNAVAGGLIAIAGIILILKVGLSWDNLLIMFATLALLASKRIPAPLIVLGVLFLGFLSL